MIIAILILVAILLFVALCIGLSGFTKTTYKCECGAWADAIEEKALGNNKVEVTFECLKCGKRFKVVL